MVGPAESGTSLQHEILELIAGGASLSASMDRLCLRAEALLPDAVCSVIGASDDGTLYTIAGPSLPEDYCEAVRQCRVGPATGSCGTAMYRGAAVEVTDIANDPLWDGLRELPLALGLRACWSTPIKAQDGRIVGSFAFYYRTARGTGPVEKQIVATCVQLCSLAIEHEAIQGHYWRLAHQDSLTGLFNRVHFNQIIARERARPGATCGLLLIDIDHLKTVNDTLGHAIGDALIATVGVRLRGIGPDCLAFRIGGDEFAMLLPWCDREDALGAAAKRIIAAMETPIETDGHTVAPSVTIGGAIAGRQDVDGVSLRQNADLALYHAKETCRGGYVPFRIDLRTSMMRRVQMRQQVDLALNDGRMLVYYQPIVRLDTNEIVGVEALSRMRLPDGRVVTAGEFHEALDDPKIAYRLTGRMLDTIADDIAHWRASGVHFQHVGLNAAPADFLKGDLVQRIVQAFDAVRVPLDHLIVEVTEKVFMGARTETVAGTIAALREHGMRVALDDFGTGYASLTHLLDFPVDIIKIDRSFVSGMRNGTRSAAVVESMITLAERLGMRVVAEGIEDMAQAAHLLGAGCRLGQGFLYSKAVPAEVAAGLIRQFGQPRVDDGQAGRIASAA